MPAFEENLDELRQRIVAQGHRVVEQVLKAVEAYFEHSEEKAAAVVAEDESIDREDIAIERLAVSTLTLGEREEYRVRAAVMILKVNNELERIGDCAVNIAEVLTEFEDTPEPIPQTFRVMANSVIGMCRDSIRALADLDVQLSQQVLNYDEAVDQFKREIGLDAERKVAAGAVSVGFAFRLRTVVSNLERIADHCTNITQQVMYLQSGMTVKHRASGWTEPSEPQL